MRYPTLAGIENSDQQTSTATPQLAAALGVSAVWLATGKESRTLNAVKDSTAANPSQNLETESHSLAIEPDILHEALTLIAFDELMAGAYPPRSQSRRLAELYARVAADGGKLTDAHNNAFVTEVQSRAAKGKVSVATHPTVRRNARR